uniref:Uncharacterized protein n=1 Tax=Trypanosoma vivax (strain Y486) TaxID=1055687 RepID=G0TVV7_TRYVY|nr:conserved hypothetical protein [Trypanosoma vivax Y486]
MNAATMASNSSSALRCDCGQVLVCLTASGAFKKINKYLCRSVARNVTHHVVTGKGSDPAAVIQRDKTKTWSGPKKGGQNSNKTQKQTNSKTKKACVHTYTT